MRFAMAGCGTEYRVGISLRPPPPPTPGEWYIFVYQQQTGSYDRSNTMIVFTRTELFRDFVFSQKKVFMFLTSENHFLRVFFFLGIKTFLYQEYCFWTFLYQEYCSWTFLYQEYCSWTFLYQEYCSWTFLYQQYCFWTIKFSLNSKNRQNCPHKN